LRSVWESEPGWQSESTVTEHVRRLRAKIEADPKKPRLIRTLRGAGYRFDPPVATPPISPVPRPAPHVSVLTSVDGFIVHVDAAALALLGATSEGQLLGRSVLDVVADQSRAAVQARIDARAAGSDPRSQILVMTSLQGEDLQMVVTGSAERWEGQDAVRSELRHASDEAARFRELVTGVLSDVTDAVIITDMELHIRSWNRSAERLYGWSVSEVLGRHVLDVLDWLGDHGTLAETWEEISSTGHWYGRVAQRTRDGRAIEVRSTVTLVCDGDGEPIGVAAVNRLASHDADATARVLDSETVAALRHGLRAGELAVYYQPVVDLADGRVITLEALVRWNHPTRGLLSPGSFLREAEESGMIAELGAHVLTVACSQVARWRRAGNDVTLAVNLSARELADPLLVERITATARSTGFDLNALWLEVTETALVEDVEQASLRLHQLADLGVGISIDDFGTGWASLTYLRQFPIHVLKIDRSFVSGLHHEPQCAAIIRSILSLAAELDLIVVAEGIETIAEESALRDMGCSIGQGFLYGHPAPARDVDLHHMNKLADFDGLPRATNAGSLTKPAVGIQG
jgi:PAS domain S-box-containing protein